MRKIPGDRLPCGAGVECRGVGPECRRVWAGWRVVEATRTTRHANGTCWEEALSLVCVELAKGFRVNERVTVVTSAVVVMHWEVEDVNEFNIFLGRWGSAGLAGVGVNPKFTVCRWEDRVRLPGMSLIFEELGGLMTRAPQHPDGPASSVEGVFAAAFNLAIFTMRWNSEILGLGIFSWLKMRHWQLVMLCSAVFHPHWEDQSLKEIDFDVFEMM